MNIAASVCQVMNVTFETALWDIPAAIAYQIHLLHCQQNGADLLIDDRIEIRRALEDAAN